MTSTQSLRYDTCPVWCTADHGSYDGEEDHLHTGADLHISDDLVVRLCAYVDPGSGNADGPYIYANSDEWTPERARQISVGLMELANLAESANAAGQLRAVQPRWRILRGSPTP